GIQLIRHPPLRLRPHTTDRVQWRKESMAERSDYRSSAATTASIGGRLDRMPIVRAHRTMTALIGFGLFFDYFDSNLSGTMSKVLQVEFGVGGTSLKLFLASGFIGQFLGSIVLGRLADRVGRRRAFMVNLLTYSLFTLLGAFSPNANWLILTRFLAGVGIGGEQPLADCYLAEILPARHRGRFIGWAYSLAYCGVPAVGFTALWLAPRPGPGVAGMRMGSLHCAGGHMLVGILTRRHHQPSRV